MIRKAEKKDAHTIAKLMLLAMNELTAKFRGDHDPIKSLQLLEKFISITGNQYSYTNVLVFEIDDIIVGSLTAYDGGEIETLRKPFFDYLITNYHPNGFDMELETTDGEFYFDVIGVDPDHQKKGIGKQLITAGIEWAKTLGHQKVGLLVNVENHRAKSLYERLGFKKIDQRFLLGSTHDHLVLNLT